MRIAVGFAVLVASSLAACGGSNKGAGDDDSQTDAGPGEDSQPLVQCTSDDDCNADQRCETTTGTCVGGCGAAPLHLSYVPANFGLVLDRSCSMKKVLTGTTTSKWAAAVAAIDHATTLHDTDVRWGLTMFPDITGASCTQDASAFPIADGNGPGIRAMLHDALDTNNDYFPKNPCVTNIDTGIESAALDPALDDPAHKSYLMLISDGAQSGTCDDGGGDAGTEAAIHDLYANRGIPTFVVGFGSEVDTNELNKLANKGGVPLSGTTKYYQADDASQLDAVFQQISGLVVSCSYTIDPAPADLGLTWVYFGTTLVPRDTTQAAGWDYDEATHQMTFYGSYCTSLTSHAVTDVDVLYGCPTPPIL